MWTLVFALLFLLILNQSSEGIFRLAVRLPPAFAAIRIGQVSFRARTYRPNRVYYRLAWEGA